jgi:hypothetical protein
MDIEFVLLTLGGVATGTTLQTYGYTRRHLAAWAATHSGGRIRQGIYGLPDADPQLRAAAAHGGMLTCVSLLRLKGVWLLANDRRAHVWLGGKGRRHEHPGCCCQEHWNPGKARVGPVSVETALIHMSRCASELAFFVAFESAWRQNMLSAAARERIRRAVPLVLRRLLEFAVGTSDSGLESIFRYRSRPSGWTVCPQPSLRRVGRVDFIINGRVIVEVDGWEFHTSEAAFAKDRQRQAEASIQGLETLNFSYHQVLNDWPTIQASISAALLRADD